MCNENIMTYDLLSKNDCKLSFRVKEYQGSHVKKYAVKMYEKEEVTEIADLDVKWECTVYSKPVPEKTEAMDLWTKFKVKSGSSNNASVGIEFHFDNWSADNYVLMPGAVYNGNRYESKDYTYCPILGEDTVSPDMPVIITDIPRLNNNQDTSKIQLKSGCMSTPAIGFFSPGRKKGYWILTHQATSIGDTGIEIEENADKSRAFITLSAPVVREDFIYKKFTTKHPSSDKGTSFAEGDEIILYCRIMVFACEDIQGLFDRFIEIRKDLTGKTVLHHEIPFSSTWDILEEKLNRENWFEERNYYADLNGQWVTGWVRGMLETFPLLMKGIPLSRGRAIRNLDFFFNNALSPSGFFYDKCVNGEWQGTYKRYALPHTEKWLLIRRNAEVLYFSLKQFILFNKQDKDFEIPVSWINAVRTCTDAFVCLWKKCGQFGMMIDHDTGDICAGGTTSGGIAPAALALAYQYFGKDEYLEIAIESAIFYHNRDVAGGMTNGGPGDAVQCPDSESAFHLLESFVVLYEVTGEKRWIDFAKEIANQCATWVISYDYHFPSESTAASLNMKTTGAVYANVQNTCGVPGICTLSGDSLFKLYRATGDIFYLELIRDIAHSIPQYMSRNDRPIRSYLKKYIPQGWINERVVIGEFDVPIGEFLYSSNWCELACMLTIVEVPGIYIQPDSGFVYAIDHVNAEIIENNYKQLVVKISNPTNFQANVKLFIEDSSNIARPLGQAALLYCKTVQVAAHGYETVNFEKM